MDESLSSCLEKEAVWFEVKLYRSLKLNHGLKLNYTAAT